MWSRGRWVRVGVAALLVGLVVGRWVAVTVVERAWASALGIGSTHAHITELQITLQLIAFTCAAVWCVGNLYVLYRSIGSVHVPRRLGNLEFVEAVPPRYLLAIVVLIGLALALALSYQAGDWWQTRALADGWTSVGLADPLLDRDVGYYLFELAWQRTLHSFVTVSAGVVLAATAVLYAAVGAVRWSNRRVHVMDTARLHLGGLLAVFALALFWGYQLEPVEYVAGIHAVPLDAVLLDVRFPAARLFSSLALVVAGASVLWIWTNRTSLVGISWTVLGIVSFAGHYVVPAFAAAVRPAEQLALPDLAPARRALLERAYAIPGDAAQLRLTAVPEPRRLAAYQQELERAPVWDAFAVTAFLDRRATAAPHERFHGTALAAYPASDGSLVPVYVSARQIDLAAAGARRPTTSWERVHAGALGAAAGAVAVQAHRWSREGTPLFVPHIARPESSVVSPTDLELARRDITFGPATTDFLMVRADTSRYLGARLGGVVSRLPFALVLQSPRLVTAGAADAATMLLWHRALPSRLERYAPFARFGAPYPVVVEGRVVWLAAGYVTSAGYPLAPALEWRGERVRSLRSSFIGVVDAHSGATRVYLTADPDPISAAWARLIPEIVRPADELPEPLARHVRYPEELFRMQLRLLREEWDSAAAAALVIGNRAGAVRGSAEAFWWVGRSPTDPVPRLRIAAALEEGDAPSLRAWVEGTSVGGAHRLRVVRLRGPGATVTPSDGVRLLTDLGADTSAVTGVFRSPLLADGLLGLQASYAADGTEPPRLREVGVAWGGVAARGATTGEALRRVQLLTPPPRQASEDWVEARRWFDRLDGALRAGDWAAFGRAYEELRRMLAPVDSTP